MSTRLLHRPYGRERIEADPAPSHLIKMGFDRRQLGRDGMTEKERAKYIGNDGFKQWMLHKRPGKTHGFFLCLNSLDERGFYMIDWNAMAALSPNYNEAAIRKAMLGQGTGNLPQELNFVIAGNASKDDAGTWHYPGLFTEKLECWDGGADDKAKIKAGPFCSGDGETAMRRQADGSYKKIECVPVGRHGKTAAELCKFSCSKACKGRMKMTLILYTPDASGKPKPLSRALGMAARYQFLSSSGWNPHDIIQRLDEWSPRIDGEFMGIRGVITFRIQSRQSTEGKYPTPQFGFHMDLADLLAREERVRARKLRERELHIEERKVAGHLPAPEEKPTPPKQDQQWDSPIYVDVEAEETEDPREEPTPEPTESHEQREPGDDGEDRGEPEPEEESSEPKPENAPAPKSGDWNPGPQPDGEFIRGRVAEVSEKSGETNGKPWTKYGIKIGKSWFGTFDERTATMLIAAKDQSLMVEIVYETKGKYSNILWADWAE